MKKLLVLAILLVLSACSSKKKYTSCDYNDECPAGYRCEKGKCVDIHHPFLGGPRV